MKKIHVLYIITKLELGGAQKVCLSLFKGIDEAFLLSGNQGPLVKEVKEHAHTILLESMTREFSFTSILYELKNFFSLIKHIRKLKHQYPELIVHTHSTKAGILGRWAAWIAGIKTRVHTVHGYGFNDYQPLFIWLVIYTIELLTSFITSHFVCVSHVDQKTGQQLFPWFSKKSTLIRAAVDDAIFVQPARPEREIVQETLFIFGTISCFKPQKNLFDLLQAFAHVHATNANTRLEIIGDGLQRAAIEQWIANHHLHKAITLHGWQDNVVPYLAHWHAFVLSSLWEGLPCAVIEARLAQLPVLCYNTGGISEVIYHGINGLLYPQKNWPALADGMLKVSTDANLYQNMYAYKDDLQQFTTRVMVEEHTKLYRQLTH